MTLTIAILTCVTLLVAFASLILYRRNALKEQSAFEEVSRSRRAAVAAERGERYATILDERGEMAAEVDAFAQQHGMRAVSSASRDDVGMVLTVSADGGTVLILGKTKDGMYRRRLSSNRIDSVEVLNDTATALSRMEDGRLSREYGGMVFADFSHPDLGDAWLVISVDDPHSPCMVIGMPDIRTAEQWHGILSRLAVPAYSTAELSGIAA